MDAQTLIIIAALAGMMTTLVRMNNTSTQRLDERLVTQIGAVKTELGSLAAKVDTLGTRLTRVEAEVGELKSAVAGVDPRLSKVEAEIGELRAAVVRMDSRLYDLATGRHTPLIIPGH